MENELKEYLDNISEQLDDIRLAIKNKSTGGDGCLIIIVIIILLKILSILK